MEIRILNLEKKPDTGVVEVLHWEANSSDSEHEARCYGSLELSEIDPNDPNFISFEELTEAQVVSWFLEILGESVASLESNLLSQLEEKKKKANSLGTPW